MTAFTVIVAVGAGFVLALAMLFLTDPIARMCEPTTRKREARHRR